MPTSCPPPSVSPGVLTAPAPADDQHPARTSAKNFKMASVAPSFHNFLTAGAFGCFHPQSLPTRFHSLRIWGAQALHSTRRWWRDSLLPQLRHRHSLDSLLRGPVILSWRKEPISAGLALAAFETLFRSK